MANFMREELSLKTLTEILKFESFPNIYLYGSTIELCEIRMEIFSFFISKKKFIYSCTIVYNIL